MRYVYCYVHIRDEETEAPCPKSKKVVKQEFKSSQSDYSFLIN